jgi:serine/threonine protein kinase
MATVTLRARYQVLRPLGRGGMGAVYLARDLTLQEQYLAHHDDLRI